MEPKFCHKDSPLDPTLNQLSLFHNIYIYKSILILASHLIPGLPNYLYLSKPYIKLKINCIWKKSIVK